MSLLAVTSASPGAGKTTVAALLAYRLLAEGRQVLLLRVKGPAEDPEPASADASLLASVQGNPAVGAPVAAAEAARRAGEAGKDIVTIVETPADAAGDIVTKARGRLVVVVPGLSDGALNAAQALARELGAGTGTAAVAVAVPHDRLAEAPSLLASRSLGCLGALAEDALLAGPRVSEVARALEATFLSEDGDLDEVAEHLMIGPISSDAGEPYFGRHQWKAAITRFDKTDVQLAALASPPLACLVLTGGQQPSPYLLDRVQSEEVPVLLTRHETVEAMRVLEGLYGATRLGGPRKLERLRELSREMDWGKLSALAK